MRIKLKVKWGMSFILSSWLIVLTSCWSAFFIYIIFIFKSHHFFFNPMLQLIDFELIYILFSISCEVISLKQIFWYMVDSVCKCIYCTILLLNIKIPYKKNFKQLDLMFKLIMFFLIYQVVFGFVKLTGSYRELLCV